MFFCQFFLNLYLNEEKNKMSRKFFQKLERRVGSITKLENILKFNLFCKNLEADYLGHFLVISKNININIIHFIGINLSLFTFALST